MTSDADVTSCNKRRARDRWQIDALHIKLENDGVTSVVRTFSSGLHAVGDVDCVTKQTVPRHRNPHHSADHRAQVQAAAYRQLPVWTMRNLRVTRQKYTDWLQHGLSCAFPITLHLCGWPSLGLWYLRPGCLRWTILLRHVVTASFSKVLPRLLFCNKYRSSFCFHCSEVFCHIFVSFRFFGWKQTAFSELTIFCIWRVANLYAAKHITVRATPGQNASVHVGLGSNPTRQGIIFVTS